jgi:hypothetical protein
LAPEHGVHAFQCFSDRIRVIVTTFNDIDGSPEGLREFSMVSHDDAHGRGAKFNQVAQHAAADISCGSCDEKPHNPKIIAIAQPGIGQI